MKFSVIIPFYNVDFKCIKNSCLSVINSFDKILYLNHTLEIILINDACVLNKDELIISDFISEYKSEYISIIYFKNIYNKGPSYSRNLGVRNSNADFISFLDADDIFLRNYYETFLQTYQVYSNFDFYTFAYKINFFKNYRLNILSINKYQYWKYFCTISIIIKRDIFKNIEFDEEVKIGEDIKFFNTLLLKNIGLHTNEIVSKYIYDYKSYKKYNFRLIKFLYYIFKFSFLHIFFKMKKHTIVN
jgi:glycosyltransferase involved in cell wall biosynthesis